MAEYFGAEVPAAEESEMTLGSWAGLTALPSPYTSPPYLTARPDITSLQVRGFPPPFLSYFTIYRVAPLPDRLETGLTYLYLRRHSPGAG